MRERDLNLSCKDERELTRIKTILFPKKERLSRVEPASLPEEGRWEAEPVRSEIDKLRSEITTLICKGRSSEIISNSTERAYLDGISKLTKELKNNVGEINEVFDEFLLHLPTKLFNEARRYNQHYHFSLLLQNVIWRRVEGLISRNKKNAFAEIKVWALRREEVQARLRKVEESREEREKERVRVDLGRAFQSWRLNNKLEVFNSESSDYLREHNLQTDQRLIQSLLNLPLLVLMLEEVGRDDCDISQLLLIDSSLEKACKFMQQGRSLINSSVETVTQRSLLYSERSSDIKFSRYDFAINSGLTKLAIQKQEILFVSNLSKHLQYSQVDNLCYWQSLGKSHSQCLKGGAIFYPIFDSNQHCIGVLRQYFYQSPLVALPSKKLQKICGYLELGLNLDTKMRSISREKVYHQQGYYLKFIGLIKSIEESSRNEKQSMSGLEEGLQAMLEIEKLNIYRVEPSSEVSSGLVMRLLWGQGEDSSTILSATSQLLRQLCSYIYLQNRLLVYSNMILFDLKIKENSYMKETNKLPVDLLVSSLTKIQTIISCKERESKQEVKREEIAQKVLQIEEKKNFYSKVSEASLNFLSVQTSNEDLYAQILNYFEEIEGISQKCSFFQRQSSHSVDIYLQYQLGRSKRQVTRVNLLNKQVVQNPPEQKRQNQIVVEINQCSSIRVCSFICNAQKQLNDIIKNTLRAYVKKYISAVNIAENQLQSAQIMRLFEQGTQQQLSFSSSLKMDDRVLWEVERMKCACNSIRKAFDSFVHVQLGQFKQAQWLREPPSAQNLHEWKQIIYKLIMAKGDMVNIEINNKNSLLSLKSYRQICRLLKNSIPQIDQQSFLVISQNKAYRTKNSYFQTNGIVLKTEAFIHFSEEDGSGLGKMVEALKYNILQICRSYVKDVSDKKRVLQNIAAKTVNALTDKLYRHCLSSSFRAIKCSKRKIENLHLSCWLFTKHIQNFTKRLISKSFYCIKDQNINAHMIKRQLLIELPFEQFSKMLSNVVYRSTFQKLIRNSELYANITKMADSLQLFKKIKETSDKRDAFLELYMNFRREPKLSMFLQVLARLRNKQTMQSFYRIKMEERKDPSPILSHNEFQEIQTMHHLRQRLEATMPDYYLSLQLNSQDCIQLYSPSGKSSYCIKKLQQALIPEAPLLSYQAGSQGQLIWNYSTSPGESCFDVKDRLNHYSRCIEVAIQHCRKNMEMALFQCSSFSRGWIRHLKVRYFKSWGSEARRLGMAERNRLNDGLYQLSVEMQTVREKLKAQQKVLRSNFIQHEELLKKQQELKLSIEGSAQKISIIEENQVKLQNAKFIYLSLHRRSVAKTIFLLWRKNAANLNIQSMQQKLKSNKFFSKTAVKAIANLILSKKKQHYNNLLYGLMRFRREPIFKLKDIQKIEVLFQDKGSRLITFQSELQQQQNSNPQSNRSSKEQSLTYSKRHFDLGQRSPLQRVQLSAQDQARFNQGVYKLNPKTLKFLKRMGKLQSHN